MTLLHSNIVLSILLVLIYFHNEVNAQQKVKKVIKNTIGPKGPPSQQNGLSPPLLKTKRPSQQTTPQKGPGLKSPNRPNNRQPAKVAVKNRPDMQIANNVPPNSSAAKERCFICSTTYSVPQPRLILLNKACSDWNRQEYSTQDCRNIQATVGAACQCEYPPEPQCNVCEDGDYIWKNAPQYNTFTDDWCVKMIYKMSQRYEYCVGNKEHVSRMCCNNTCKAAYTDRNDDDRNDDDHDDDRKYRSNKKSKKYSKGYSSKYNGLYKRPQPPYDEYQTTGYDKRKSTDTAYRPKSPSPLVPSKRPPPKKPADPQTYYENYYYYYYYPTSDPTPNFENYYYYDDYYL